MEAQKLQYEELDKLSLLPEEGFVKALKQQLDKEIAFLDKNKMLDSVFIRQNKKKVSLNYALRLLNYWKTNNLQEATIIKKELESFNFSDPERFESDYFYKHFVKQKFDLLSDLFVKENNVKKYNAYIDVIRKADLTKEMKEVLLMDYLLELFNLTSHSSSKLHFDELKKIKDIYFEALERIENKKKIAAVFDKLSSLQPGMLAPDFSLLNEKEEKISLSDFRGKYVFIDVWATWCGGCVRDLPVFKKLVADYKHKNLVTIKVTLDSNKDIWKKYLKKKELTGINLSADKKFKEDYLIRTISRYLLIDPAGKIVTVNAPLPDSKEIRTLLDSIK